MVSFVLPVYNVSKYLRTCVDSLLNQTDGRFEAILVDDGSTDGSGALCDQLAAEDARLRVIHQQNAGSGYARNAGLLAARGKYVSFVDPDDYVQPDLIEKCLAAAEESGADMVVFGHTNDHYGVDGSLHHKTVTIPKLSGFYAYDRFMANFYEFFKFNAYNVWLRFYSREYLTGRGLLFTNQRIGQDAVFCIDVLEKGFDGISYLPLSLYNHELRDGSAVNRYQPTRYQCELNIARRLRALFQKLGLLGDRRFAQLSDDRFVMAVSIEVGNLVTPQCPMSAREAAKWLAKAASDPDIQKSVSDLPLSYYQKGSKKVMLLLLKMRMYGLLLALKRRGTRKI